MAVCVESLPTMEHPPTIMVEHEEAITTLANNLEKELTIQPAPPPDISAHNILLTPTALEPPPDPVTTEPPSSAEPASTTEQPTPQPAQQPAEPPAQQPAEPTATITTQQSVKIQETYPYTCPLCFEEFLERKHLYRVVGCRHLYCRQCVTQYYALNVKDGKCVVKCPQPTCPQEILFRNVKELVPDDVFLLHQRLTLRVNANTNNFIWCPGDNCKSKLSKSQAKAGVVICYKCKLRVCFKCSEWEHPGVPCYDAHELTDKKIKSEREAKVLFEQWQAESGVKLKICPKCGACIERTEGCSHMVCKICQHQFCFVCLQPTRATHCRS